MKPRTAIVAAMERELRPLLRASDRKWELEKMFGGVTVYCSESAIAAFAGMGSHRVALAANAALSLGPASRLISAGWAGGLHPGMLAGMTLRVGAVIEEATGEIFTLDQTGAGSDRTRVADIRLVTVDRFVSSEEKRRLRGKYSADLVDMEAASVARIAATRGIPFLAIKAVSDEHDFELPELARFATREGQFRQTDFALHVALRPRLWRPVARMARGSSTAARGLCEALGQAIDFK